MKKKLLCLMLAAAFLLALPITASAQVGGTDGYAVSTGGYGGASTPYDPHPPDTGQTGGYPITYSGSLPYPIDIQSVNIGGVPYIYKTYSVQEGTDPVTLVEEPFKQAGYQYRHYEIIQQELVPSSSERQETQLVTKETDSDKTEQVLALFEPAIHYDDGQGFTGSLVLQPASLQLTENGRESYSYGVSEVQEYPGLTRNDTSTIPKSINKNGVTLSLQSIDWIVTGSENAGYSAIPTGYTAVATYGGVTSGSKVSGYTATVSYTGAVSKSVPGRAVYTIVYEGERIVIPVNYVPYIITGLLAAMLIAAGIAFLSLRPNVEIYKVIDGVPELYKKVRLKTRNPIIDLSMVEGVGVRLIFNKGFVKKLYDQKVFVVGRYINYDIDVPATCVQELGAQFPETKKKEETGSEFYE